MSNLQIKDSFEPYVAKRNEAPDTAKKPAASQPEMRQALREMLQKRGSAKPASASQE